MGDADRRAGALSSLGEGWDNDDVRVRPGRSSRPRTKTRPAHHDAIDGFVIAVDRGRYTCLIDEGKRSERTVTAMRASELRKHAVVVGDHTALVGDTSGGADSLARIVRIADRRSILRRSADDTDTAERVLVAGADQLLIVVAAAEPEPRRGFIDRCLVAAYTGHLTPLLLVTKADLRNPADLLEDYRDLELTILTSGRGESTAAAPADAPLDDAALAAVRASLTGRITALVGHSGVGKSTLVNALVPQAARAIGEVTAVGKGRHTSSSAIALPLPDGGWVIDTPGVRSFGLAHVAPDDVVGAFDELLPATADCAPNCSHESADIGCALDNLVTSGVASAGRLASLRRLLASRAGAGDSSEE